MRNEIRLLARLADGWNAAPVTLLNPPEATAAHCVAAAEICSDDYTIQQACARRRQTPSCRFGIPTVAPAAARVVLFPPRARRRLAALLSLQRGALQQPIELILIGAKRSGIGGAHKLLEGIADAVQRIDAARHCQAFCATLLPGPRAELDDWLTWHPIAHGDTNLAIASLPGVFASGRLDPGTALLLQTLIEAGPPAPGAERALDFGCGAGILAAALSNQGWQVDAVDNDYWALQAAQATLQANALPVATQPITGAGGLNRRYSLIVTNPPFHQGVDQTTSTARDLISRLPKLLQPGGQALIVANRFLPYEAAARRAGLAVEPLASESGYKLLRLRAPS